MDMNFRQFIEAKLGSFTYALPNDKEKQLYDFYMLSALRSEDPDIKEAIRHTREKLLPTLKKELLKAVFFSLMSELRHGASFVGDRWGKDDLDDLTPPYKELFLKYAKNLHGYMYGSGSRGGIPPEAFEQHPGESFNRKMTHAAAIKAGPQWKMVELARRVYNNLSWPGGYGGPAWGKVARGWLKLNDAENLKDMQVWIDHVYDLQHNSDTIFDKLNSYYKDGYGWILRALNHKARIKSPWEIFDKTSEEMKRLAGFAMKGQFPAHRVQKGHEAQFATRQGFQEFGEHEYKAGSKVVRLTQQQVRKLIEDARAGRIYEFFLDKFKHEGLEYRQILELIEDIRHKNNIGEEGFKTDLYGFLPALKKDVDRFIKDNRLLDVTDPQKLQRLRIPGAIEADYGVSILYARQIQQEMKKALAAGG